MPPHLPDDLRTRCLAASLLLPDGHAFDGPTACALWACRCRAGTTRAGVLTWICT